MSRFGERRILPSLAIATACLLAALLTTTGCTEDPPLSLSSKSRVKVDTLYSRRVRKLRPKLDSMCEARFDREVARLVDSLLEVQRSEAAKLRARSDQRMKENEK